MQVNAAGVPRNAFDHFIKDPVQVTAQGARLACGARVGQEQYREARELTALEPLRPIGSLPLER